MKSLNVTIPTTLRVLIVDNSEGDAELLLQSLRRGGWKVTHERVETADAMTAALDKYVWDIIIADYSLPGFSGPAALALAIERSSDLPFILVSTTVSEETAVHAIKSGADDYFSKGNFSLLVPAVARELLKAERRREAGKVERQLRADRERAEGQIQQANFDLKAALKHQAMLSRELAAAKELADAANVAKSSFLANMSHEIRTPMTAILGYADLMLDPNRDDSARHNDLQSIRRNGQHLLQVINDVLDLSKIEAGGMTIEQAPVDLPCFAAEAMSMTRPKAIEKNLLLRLEFASLVPRTVLTDPLRLRQVLINLIGNAIKFTPKGTVTLRVTCDGPSATDGVVRFAVVDTGVGMDAAAQARLFQPFVQADASTTRRFGGTGLGLTISRQFALMLGGDIAVHSEPDVGSTFTLDVRVGPIMVEDMVSGLTEACAYEDHLDAPDNTFKRLAGIKILLAEDGLDNREILTAYLCGAGATVETVEDGRSAVTATLNAAAAGHPFAVVLMDMQMPVLDGCGATSKLRRRGYRGSVIALTANAMADDRAKCLAAGCDDYLSKPIDRRVLIAAIARQVGEDVLTPAVDTQATTPANAKAVTDVRDHGFDAVIRSPLSADPKLAAVVHAFVSRLPDTAVELRRLNDPGDSADLARVAHKLRGAGGSYGFTEISILAAQVENRLIAGEAVSAVTADVVNLIGILRRVDGYDQAAERAALSKRETPTEDRTLLPA